jgi:membrane associated rhomboid family serine protease
MQTGGGHFAGHNPAHKEARTPVSLSLACLLLIATLYQCWGADLWPVGANTHPSGGWLGWENCASLDWTRLRQAGEWWRILSYCAVHHSPWHALAGILGIYSATKAIEPIIGTVETLCAALLGSFAGALAQSGLCVLASLPPLATAPGTEAAALGIHVELPPLVGTLPMVAALVGVYSTVLPGWRMGAASRCNISVALTAGGFGCIAAAICVVWWLSGWFPQGGPAPVLAGLCTGWAFARVLGYGPPFFSAAPGACPDAEGRNAEAVEWEEFMRTQLNPVLEKISTHGISSLTQAEWKILQKGRRKLEES